jgi:REase_DpnII-MboI
MTKIRYTRAFGKDFTRLTDSHLEDLQSLERESAIYADHWIDELRDFRHVRIVLAPGEVKDYVRSLWAFELFLRAGSPRRASEVKGIPKDIAKRADSYGGAVTRSGVTLPKPWHCAAAFLGKKLEAAVCSNIRAEILEESGRRGLLLTITRAIDAIAPAIRSFQRREKGLISWPVSGEDDVRDLLHVMLRPAISDIRREEPVPSRGGTHKFVDLYSALGAVFIEIKWIYKKGSWKRIMREINDDIQSYPSHPRCSTLIFLVIDAVRDIPDPAQLEQSLTCEQTIDGKKVDVRVFVREQ